MKTFFARLAVLFAMTGWLAQSHAVVTVSVTPTTVSNTYGGSITIQVTGLTNGETVLVQKFLDANGNGSIDTGETLWQQGKLTDAKAAVFHDGLTAVTNLNIPGDLDSTPGQITAVVNLSGSGFEQTIVGKYLTWFQAHSEIFRR